MQDGHITVNVIHDATKCTSVIQNGHDSVRTSSSNNKTLRFLQHGTIGYNEGKILVSVMWRYKMGPFGQSRIVHICMVSKHTCIRMPHPYPGWNI